MQKCLKVSGDKAQGYIDTMIASSEYIKQMKYGNKIIKYLTDLISGSDKI